MPETRRVRRDGPRIRRLAADENVDILINKKAAHRLRQENISRPDALMAICNCRVITSEHRHGQWRRTIRGQDADGESIELVVVIDCNNDRRIVIFSGKRVR